MRINQSCADCGKDLTDKDSPVSIIAEKRGDALMVRYKGGLKNDPVKEVTLAPIYKCQRCYTKNYDVAGYRDSWRSKRNKKKETKVKTIMDEMEKP